MAHQRAIPLVILSLLMVSKSIKKLNPKKATGVDQLPAKLIKAGSEALAGPISTVYNVCAKLSQFPDDLKSAQVCPIYIKDDPFVKKNYRPVSILTSHSKIFEYIMFIQLNGHFNSILTTTLLPSEKALAAKQHSSGLRRTGKRIWTNSSMLAQCLWICPKPLTVFSMTLSSLNLVLMASLLMHVTF